MFDSRVAVWFSQSYALGPPCLPLHRRDIVGGLWYDSTCDVVRVLRFQSDLLAPWLVKRSRSRLRAARRVDAWCINVHVSAKRLDGLVYSPFVSGARTPTLTPT